jgi:hypothetical protein
MRTSDSQGWNYAFSHPVMIGGHGVHRSISSNTKNVLQIDVSRAYVPSGQSHSVEGRQ